MSKKIVAKLDGVVICESETLPKNYTIIEFNSSLYKLAEEASKYVPPTVQDDLTCRKDMSIIEFEIIEN